MDNIFGFSRIFFCRFIDKVFSQLLFCVLVACYSGENSYNHFVRHTCEKDKIIIRKYFYLLFIGMDGRNT